ncbi:FAD-dependent oxidoreductase [Pseudonocardia spinosispora]|uniref:FAD-dependent oxidoreductase n=1 Tax=Pseudonocardia spinosispora TaxID=103441 RepID=UPI000420564B|nr:FAD-dependent oxidoreductase [Pseudonocardia spinosispora]
MHHRAGPLRMRPQLLVPGRPDLPREVPDGVDAVVIGGGVAGISAAVVLAERGVRVTLLEAAGQLGGRLGAWPHRMPDGSEQIVEHGFHAFFRQYYTWRAILRRADPALRFLRPTGSYPVLSARWPEEDLTGLPATPPLSLLTLFARSPSLGWRDLVGANRTLGLELLGFDQGHPALGLEALSAGEFLNRLNLSERARSMLFEAFARSFFCNPTGMSAAELVAMFHFYFLGNPEGLAFDAPDTDYLTCIWNPLRAHLTRHGAEVMTGSPVNALVPGPDHRWRVELDARTLDTRHVLLALDPGGLRGLVDRSDEARAVAPRLAAQVGSLSVAEPYAVSRLWLDRDVSPERAVFSAVTGQDTLDSITCYHRLERGSRAWAARTGGAVLELHSYACTRPDARSATEHMLAELAQLWPETADATILHRSVRLEAEAPAFPPGSRVLRPTVSSDARGVRVAGDFVQLPYCSGLMERSAMSGVLAANDVLAEHGAGPEPVTGVPQRGLLAGLTRLTRKR